MTYIFAMRVIRNEQFFKVGLNERTNERHKIFMKLEKPHFGSILKPFSLKNSNKRILLKLLYSNFCHYAVVTSCKKSKRFYEQFNRKTPDKQKNSYADKWTNGWRNFMALITVTKPNDGNKQDVEILAPSIFCAVFEELLHYLQ